MSVSSARASGRLLLLVTLVLAAAVVPAAAESAACRRGCKAPFVECRAAANAALDAALAACRAGGAERTICRRAAKAEAKDARRGCKGARTTCRSCCKATAAGECPSECTVATGTIGPEGGSLALCGARLDVLPSTLAAATRFRIERLTTVPVLELPPDLAVAGAVHRFTPESVPGSGFLRVTLPHERPGRVVAPFVVVGDQAGFVEPCRVTDASIVFDGLSLGTFVPLHETVDYPPSVDGLGSGRVTARLPGETIEFDLDEPGSWAVHVAQGAAEVLEISGWRAAEPLRSLRLAILWNPGSAEASFVDAALGVFDGGDLTLWSAVPGVGVVALAATGAHAFQGSASVPVTTAAGAESTLDVDFAFATERWRWPFELSCAWGFD